MGFTMNAILPFFGVISALILALLPTTPFRAYMDQLRAIPWLNYFNWFFPATECVIIFETWLVCYGIILTYKVLMRYIKIL